MSPFLMQEDKPVVSDTSYELSDRNQSLIIKVLKPEHGGTYSCLVRNELDEDKREVRVTIKGKNEDITVNTISHFSMYCEHLQ
jgi:hypothetical protein